MPEDHIRLTADASSLVSAYRQGNAAVTNFGNVLSSNVKRLDEVTAGGKKIVAQLEVITASNIKVTRTYTEVDGILKTHATTSKSLVAQQQAMIQNIKILKNDNKELGTSYTTATTAALNLKKAQSGLISSNATGSKIPRAATPIAADKIKNTSIDAALGAEKRKTEFINAEVQKRVAIHNAGQLKIIAGLKRAEAGEKAREERLTAIRRKSVEDYVANNNRIAIANIEANNKRVAAAQVAKDKEIAFLKQITTQHKAAYAKRAAGARASLTNEYNAQKKIQRALKEQEIAARRVAAQQRRITKETQRSKKASVGMLISWKSIARLVGVQLIHRGIALLTSAVREAITVSIEFQQSIAEIQTIDSSQMPFDQWATDLRRLSDSWGFDLLDQAEAAYQALSNQVIDGASAFQFLNEANILAKASITSTTDSVNILSSVLNSYGLDASRAAGISDVLFKTVELGRVRIDEMATTIGRLTVPAAQLGISFEELAAGITVVTNQGVKYSEATTFLRNVLQKLLKPSEDLTAVLQRNGYQSGQAALATLGFGGTLGLLQKEAGGSSVELAEMFDRIRAIAGAFSLTGKNLDKFNANLAELENASGSAADAAKLVQDNVGRKLIIELNKTKNVFLNDFGTPILTSLNKANDALGGMSNWARGLAKIFGEVGDSASGFTEPMIEALNSIRNVDTFEKLQDDSKLFGIRTTKSIGDIVDAMHDAETASIEIGEALNKIRLERLSEVLKQLRDESREVLKGIAEDAKLLNAALGKETKALDVLIAQLEISARDTAKSMNELGQASQKSSKDAEKAWKDATKALEGFDKTATDSEINDLFDGVVGREGEQVTQKFDLISDKLSDLAKRRDELFEGGITLAEQDEFNNVNGQIGQLIDLRKEAEADTAKLNEDRVEDERKTADKILEINRKSEEKIVDLHAGLTEAVNNKDVDGIIRAQAAITAEKTKARRAEDKANLELAKRNADRQVGAQIIAPELATANLLEKERDILQEIRDARRDELDLVNEKNKAQEASFASVKKELADITSLLKTETPASVEKAVAKGADPEVAFAERRILLEREIAAIRKIGTKESEKEADDAQKRLDAEIKVLGIAAGVAATNKKNEAAQREGTKKAEDEAKASDRQKAFNENRRNLRGVGQEAGALSGGLTRDDLANLGTVATVSVQGVLADVTTGIFSGGNFNESRELGTKLTGTLQEFSKAIRDVGEIAPRLGQGNNPEAIRATSAEALARLDKADAFLQSVRDQQAEALVPNILKDKSIAKFQSAIDTVRGKITVEDPATAFKAAIENFDSSIAGKANELAVPQDAVRVEEATANLVEAAKIMSEAATDPKALTAARNATATLFNSLGLEIPDALTDALGNLRGENTGKLQEKKPSDDRTREEIEKAFENLRNKSNGNVTDPISASQTGVGPTAAAVTVGNDPATVTTNTGDIIYNVEQNFNGPVDPLQTADASVRGIRLGTRVA